MNHSVTADVKLSSYLDVFPNYVTGGINISTIMEVIGFCMCRLCILEHLLCYCLLYYAASL